MFFDNFNLDFYEPKTIEKYKSYFCFNLNHVSDKTKMNEIQTTRTDFLSALCIATFIGSSASFIVYFLAAIFFDQASGFIIKYSNWHSTEAISPLYFTLFMVVSAVSLTGAIRMWKLHRDGFYIYTVAQIILLFIPVFWVGWNSFSVTGTIFTIVFVGGYGLNLRQLNR